MIVECNSCHSRYRLNLSIMKGHQGAEVRCRKCGGTFVILVPAVRRDNPLPPQDPVRLSADPERIPPERTRDRPLPAAANLDHRETALRDAPAGNVPENVYSLFSYREDPARRVPPKSFDISGAIRPEPALARAEPEPAEAAVQPAEAPPREGNPDPPPLVDLKLAWKEEGVIASTSGVSRSAPGIVKGPTPWVPGPSTFLEALPKPVSRSFSHVALVYLAMLFIGGCGYLLLSLLSGYLSGGG